MPLHHKWLLHAIRSTNSFPKITISCAKLLFEFIFISTFWHNWYKPIIDKISACHSISIGITVIFCEVELFSRATISIIMINHIFVAWNISRLGPSEEFHFCWWVLTAWVIAQSGLWCRGRIVPGESLQCYGYGLTTVISYSSIRKDMYSHNI